MKIIADWIGINWQSELYSTEADARTMAKFYRYNGRDRVTVKQMLAGTRWYKIIVPAEGAWEVRYHSK